jgi:hypothetical protein
VTGTSGEVPGDRDACHRGCQPDHEHGDDEAEQQPHEIQRLIAGQDRLAERLLALTPSPGG